MSRYIPIAAEFFKKNRQRFTNKMKPNTMAIFLSNDVMPRSGDGHFKFRQNPDFYYLTGIDQEECMLILYPDAKNEQHKEMLFLRETSEMIAIWEGDKVNKLQGKELSGIQSVMWNDKFDGLVNHLATQVDGIYLNTNENDRASSEVVTQDFRYAKEMKEKFPLYEFHRAAPIMGALRSIKSNKEIEVLKKACSITEKAFRNVLATTKPGMMEYEVEANIIHTFIKEGSSGHAYEPIVASGKNACVLHYISNDQECKDGDLLLMDFGAEYANYASDLTRTIPINGRFTDRQKEVYNACLHIHNEAKCSIRAGISLAEFNTEVKKMMTSALVDIRLIDSSLSEKEKNALTQKYFPHGTSHFMGLDVHDVGPRYANMENGMCFTIEPGIYIREEGIGVRIENDIIIQENGNIDLMENIPITVEEIEDLMNS